MSYFELDATPSLARQLVQFSAQKNIIVDDYIINLAKKDLIEHENPEHQNLIQYLVDFNCRATIIQTSYSYISNIQKLLECISIAAEKLNLTKLIFAMPVNSVYSKTILNNAAMDVTILSKNNYDQCIKEGHKSIVLLSTSMLNTDIQFERACLDFPHILIMDTNSNRLYHHINDYNEEKISNDIKNDVDFLFGIIHANL